MINKFIAILIKAENLARITPEDGLNKPPYKVIEQVWIRADRLIEEIYSKSIKNSGPFFYPNTNYKAWGVWFLKILGVKKSSHKLKELLGIGIQWPFLKKQYLPLSADIVYRRVHCPILIYSSLTPRRLLK